MVTNEKESNELHNDTRNDLYFETVIDEKELETLYNERKNSLYHKMDNLMHDIFEEDMGCPFYVLSESVIKKIEPYLFKENSLSEKEIKELIELAKTNDFIRYFLLFQVKELKEEYLMQLLDIVFVTDSFFYQLFEKEYIKEKHIEKLCKKIDTSAKLSLILHRSGNKMTDNFLHYIIDNHRMSEIMERNNDKYLPYRYLKDTKENRTRIINVLKETDNDETVINEIVNNVNLSPDFRDTAFDIGVDFYKVENPTPHMAINMYQAIIDIMLDEQYDKGDTGGIRRYRAEKMMERIHKILPNSCLIDFLNRYSESSITNTNLRTLITYIASETMKKNDFDNEQLQLSILKCGTDTAKDIIFRGNKVYNSVYQFFKNELSEENKRISFLKATKTEEFDEKECIEYIEKKDEEMMMVFLTSPFLTRNTHRKILQYAAENDNKELLMIEKFRNECTLTGVYGDEYRYFLKHFTAKLLSSSIKFYLLGADELDVKKLAMNEDNEKRTRKGFKEILAELKNSTFMNDKMEKALDEVYKNFKEDLELYHTITKRENGLHCYSMYKNTLYFHPDEIKEYDRKDFENFQNSLKEIKNEEVIDILMNEMATSIGEMQDDNEFHCVMLKSCQMYDMMIDRMTEIQEEQKRNIIISDFKKETMEGR